MQDIASSLHPIDYLDAVGENICDVSGTCADLFESMAPSTNGGTEPTGETSDVTSWSQL